MQNVKSSFFLKLSRSMSEDFKLPLIFTLIMETISNAQVIGSVIKGSILPSSDLNLFVSYVTDLITGSGVFSLWDVTTNNDLSVTLWVICVIFLALYTMLYIALLVLILLHVYNKYKVSRILTIVSLVHSKVFFYPFHYFFLQIINCYVNEISGTSAFVNSEIVFTLSILFLCLNMIMAVLKEIFFFRITKTKNTYSAKNNTHARLILMHKIIVPLLYILIDTTQQLSITIAIISIAYCLAALSNLYFKLPFYNMTLMRYSYILMSATLSISLVGLLNSFGSSPHISDTLLLVSTLLLVKIMMMHLNLTLERILSGELLTPERAIHFPILLKEYTSTYAGLILVRRMFPIESLYLYNSFDSNLDDANNQKDLTQERQTKQEFYSKIVDKFLASQINYSKSEVFLLFLSGIYMKKLDNASKAIQFIQKVQTMSKAFPIRNSVESVQNILQQSYFKRFSYTEDELELANYFTFREEFIALKEGMQKEIEFHLEFWQELSLDKVEVKRVVDYSNKMDQIYLRIRNRWRKKATRFTQVYPSSLLMYGLYLDSIRGLPSESMPMIQKFYNYNKSHGFKHKIGILDESSALVLASIEKEKMGTILDASNTVETLFGVPKDRMVGGKINMLMPGFISRTHDWFMQRYTQTSITKGVNQKIESFGKTFDDMLIEVEINLKLYPYLEKGVNMMSYIRQINQESRIAILSPQGALIECNLNLSEDGTKNGINFKSLNFFESSSDFTKINAAFNYVYGDKESNQAKIQHVETEVSFIKDKTWADEIQPTKELLITHNFTQLETNNDQILQSLQTKQNEDNLLASVEMGDVHKLQYPTSKTLKVNKEVTTNGKSPTLIVPKNHVKLNEEEANKICKMFKEGGYLLLDKHSSNSKTHQTLLSVTIQPYILMGEVYKILRVSNIELVQHQNVENNIEFMYRKTLTPFVSKDTKFDQLSWQASSKLSQTAGLTDEEIPEERSDDIVIKKETSIEKRISFQKISLPTESNGHLNTSTKKKEDNRFGGKGNVVHDIDIRHSLTGKGASSTKSYSHMDLKLIKTLNDFFGEEKVRLITRVSIYLVYVIMLGIFVLALVNYFFTQTALKEVRNGVTITDTASTRLTSVLKAWQWILLVYSRMVGIRPASSLAATIQKSVLTETLNMLDLNSNLRTYMNDFGSDEIIAVIVSSRVKFYDPLTQELLTGAQLDSFTGNKFLGIQNQVIGSWNGTDAELLARSEPLTTINNTANDYLVTSELQITNILGGLKDVVNKNKNNLLLILIIENLALVALALALLWVARVVIRIFSGTFKALVRLTDKSIEERIYRIKKFQSALNDNIEGKSFVQNLNLYLTFFEDNAEVRLKKAKTKEKTMRFFSKTYKMRGFIVFVAKYLAVSFVLIIATAGIFILLYTESIRSFNKLNNINAQLSVTNKLSYQSSLVVSSFYFNLMFWNQANMMIRNEDSLPQVEYNLDAFGNVNTQLLNVLYTSGTDTESKNDAILEDFLQSNVCSYIDEDLAATCENVTQGNELGLLGLNQKFYTISLNYANLFAEDKSASNIATLAQSYFETVFNDITVLGEANTFLTSHILNGFHSEVDSLGVLNLLLSLAAMLFIVFTTLVIQTITLKKLIVLDNSQKKVFRSLTYYVFSQNKSVGFLLKKEFGDEVEGLNRILYGSN